MKEKQSLEHLLPAIFEQEDLILATLSATRVRTNIEKVTIRPILIKGKISYQLTENRQKQAFHHHLTQTNCLNWILENYRQFKQIFFYTQSADYHILLGKKGNLTLLKKAPSKAHKQFIHNRQKEYLLQEGHLFLF